MKNFLIVVALILSGTVAQAECVNGKCNVGPVRRAGTTVVTTTKKVVTLPFRVTKRVFGNRLK